jgi:hypothetical protein
VLSVLDGIQNIAGGVKFFSEQNNLFRNKRLLNFVFFLKMAVSIETIEGTQKEYVVTSALGRRLV